MYQKVEDYFRKVVDYVMRDIGFNPFEVGRTVSGEGFANVEIFRNINLSSLVMVDLTGLRPNCFMEGGFAFGVGKNTILTARKGTKLPFDAQAIRCHFWSSMTPDDKRRIALSRFIKNNMGRKLVPDSEL